MESHSWGIKTSRSDCSRGNSIKFRRSICLQQPLRGGTWRWNFLENMLWYFHQQHCYMGFSHGTWNIRGMDYHRRWWIILSMAGFWSQFYLQHYQQELYINCSKIRNSNIFTAFHGQRKIFTKRVLQNCIYHFYSRRSSMEFSLQWRSQRSECGINHECDHMHIMECSNVFCILCTHTDFLIVTAYIWQGLIIAVVTFYVILPMILQNLTFLLQCCLR